MSSTSGSTGTGGSEGTGENTSAGAGGGSSTGAGGGGSTGANDDPQGSSSSGGATEAACDPAGCENYCEWARCLFSGDIDGSICTANCNAECGDAFFDGEDQSVMDCLAAVALPSLSCSDAEACCDEFFTNNICP